MPYSNIISALPGYQVFLPIIPSKTFPIPFQKVLNKIDGIITSTERKLLCLFERYCYQDGLIYPKRITIAAKLGIKPRQVSNLIRSLVDKGFISVFKAALVDRHLYGKGNSYTMLFHAAYGKIAPEKTSENPDSTFNKIKDIKTKYDFNVVEWLERNKDKKMASLVDTVKELTKRWPSIKHPGRYMDKVVRIREDAHSQAEFESQLRALETAERRNKDFDTQEKQEAERIALARSVQERQKAINDLSAEQIVMLDRFIAGQDLNTASKKLMRAGKRNGLRVHYFPAWSDNGF